MSDANIIPLAITLFAIAAGSLFNNVRISDLANATNKRSDDMRELMRAENARTQDKLETILKMMGDLETRVNHLEKREH